MGITILRVLKSSRMPGLHCIEMVLRLAPETKMIVCLRKLCTG